MGQSANTSIGCEMAGIRLLRVEITYGLLSYPAEPVGQAWALGFGVENKAVMAGELWHSNCNRDRQMRGSVAQPGTATGG